AWPDNDQTGREYAAQVAALTTDADGAAWIVSVPPGLPEKWDIADDLPDGYTQEQMFEALRTAAQWQPPINKVAEVDLSESVEIDAISKMYPLPFLHPLICY